MSLILDALHKADMERSAQQQSPHISVVQGADSTKNAVSAKRKWFFVGGLLLLLGVMAAVWLQFFSGLTYQQKPADTLSVESLKADTEATETPHHDQKPSQNTQGNELQVSIERAEKPPSAVSALYDAPIEKKQKKEVSDTRIGVPAPKASSAHVKVQARQAPVQSDVSELVPDSPKVLKSVAKDSPFEVRKIEPAPVVISLDDKSASDNADLPSLPLLSEMPTSIRSDIPTLIYSSHIYTEELSTRFVTFNGNVFVTGAMVSPGLTLESIYPGGVVMQFRGRQFTLKARNSWINP